MAAVLGYYARRDSDKNPCCADVFALSAGELRFALSKWG